MRTRENNPDLKTKLCVACGRKRQKDKFCQRVRADGESVPRGRICRDCDNDRRRMSRAQIVADPKGRETVREARARQWKKNHEENKAKLRERMRELRAANKSK